MINTTISIFAAVMMNASVFALICEQIIPSPFPRGFNLQAVKDEHKDPNHAMYFIIGFFVVLFNFFVINWLCWKKKNNHHTLFGIESITGHLCAFSGIYCFGNLMELHWFGNSPWMALLVVPIALLVCVPVLCLSKKWRISDSESGHEATTAHNDRWMHCAEEAENEALTLLTSFLISQVVGFAVIGKLPAMHHDGLELQELHKAQTSVTVLLV